MQPSGEETVVCPYNRAHAILKSKMQFHLPKCRIQHPGLEKAICPFNATHVYNKVEMPFHKENCRDRKVVDSFIYNIGDTAPPVGLQPVRSFNIPKGDDEDWDVEASTMSVLDQVKEGVQRKGVLINKIGAPKAERKAHRFAERQRFQAVTSDNLPLYDTTPSTSSPQMKTELQWTVAKNPPPLAAYSENDNFTSDVNHGHGAKLDFPALPEFDRKNCNEGTKEVSDLMNKLHTGFEETPQPTGVEIAKPNAWSKPNAWGKPLARLQNEKIAVPISSGAPVACGIGGFPVRPPSNPWAKNVNQQRPESGASAPHVVSPKPAPSQTASYGNANPQLNGIWARGAPPNLNEGHRPITSEDFPTLLPLSARGRKPRP